MSGELLTSFVQEAQELIAGASQGLLLLEQRPQEGETLNAVFRAVHTVKGASGMFPVGSLTQVVHAAEDVLAALRGGGLAQSAELITQLLAAMDQVERWLGELEGGAVLGEEAAAQSQQLSGALRRHLPSAAAPPPALLQVAAPDCVPLSLVPEALRGAAEGLLQEGRTPVLLRYQPDEGCFFGGEDPLNLLGQLKDLRGLMLVPREGRLEEPGEVDPFLCWLGFAVITGERVDVLRVQCQLVQEQVTLQRVEEPRAPAKAAGDPPKRGARTLLRVDQARIDQLMRHVGELVVAKNGLPYLARRAELQHGVPQLAREIKDQHQILHRIAEDLQGAVMQVRMVPLSLCFERAERLVRDLAQKLRKPARLQINGGDTEADKSIVDRLGDPLLHLLRNSMDHGLEDEAARAQAGKPREGALVLTALRDGDELHVSLRDDGRGIDAERVRRKVVERGLLDAAAAAALSPAEAVNLVFLPGLSTAAEVTDVSGRGVGMDVVRRDLEAMGGSVRIHSEVGRGTEVRLVVPLSMTVTRVLTVRCAGELLGVPMESVVAVLRVPAARIQRFRQHACTLWRDRLLPVRALAEVLELEEAEAAPQSHALLVVRCGGEEVGLLLERFEESIDIILRPVEGILKLCRGYLGAAILGDGRALLVLNLREILSWPWTPSMNPGDLGSSAYLT